MGFAFSVLPGINTFTLVVGLELVTQMVENSHRRFRTLLTQ